MLELRPSASGDRGIGGRRTSGVKTRVAASAWHGAQQAPAPRDNPRGRWQSWLGSWNVCEGV